ncbi:MAG TPA: hypothetical protein VKA41_03255 [Solirubrobacterales bacterium]|nr:hypothetical protein [Solirubrobacterales bacterium]
MEPAAVVTLIAVVLVILALVVYLVAVILELRKITAGLDAVIESVGGILKKSEPVNGVVETINQDLSAGTDLLEGLLDKKAGQDDAAGLVESLYPGSGASVLERQGRSGEVKNIDEVYTRGAVQLARLGRESPLGVGAMSGAALRDATYSSAAARSIYTNPSGPVADEPGGSRHRPRSPVIGTEAGADGGTQSDEPKSSDG